MAFERMEFNRHCLVRIPDIYEKYSYETVLLLPEKKGGTVRMFCSCCRGSTPKCNHAKQLRAIMEQYLVYTDGEQPQEHFKKNLFYTLLQPLITFDPISITQCECVASVGEDRHTVTVSKKGSSLPLIQYRSTSLDVRRFASRLNTSFSTNSGDSRHSFMARTQRFTMTPVEEEIVSRGGKTSRLAQEESVWYRLAYHCYREFDAAQVNLEPWIDEASGSGMLQVRQAGFSHKITISFCGDIVMTIASILKSLLPAGYPFFHAPAEHELQFSCTQIDDRIIRVEPVIAAVDTDGLNHYFPVNRKYLYGCNYYISQLRSFFVFSMASMKRISQKWLEPREVPIENFPDFLREHAAVLSRQSCSVENPGQISLFDVEQGDDFKRIVNLRLVTEFKVVHLTIVSLEKEWCTVDVGYVTENDETIPLQQILYGVKASQRYILSGKSIVDIDQKSIHRLTLAMKGNNTTSLPGTTLLHKASLLQLSRDPLYRISGLEKTVEEFPLSLFLSQAPVKRLQPLSQVRAQLRPYQSVGVQWLLFLYDFRLGGLLCDDMGLGKTLQVLSLFSAVRQQRGCSNPFLVVCPTTVMSHWQNLAEKFTPQLRLYCFHGVQRELAAAISNHEILLTSYGILRNEIERIAAITFSIAVFDEAHYLKNQTAAISRVATGVQAEVKLCLSATPIENSLTDIKTLFDLVLPGYLGQEEEFKQRFVIPIESAAQPQALHIFKQMTGPFLLRRLKSAVLSELPPKIEDKRMCEMSQEQKGLYRELTDTEGRDLYAQLTHEDDAVPYLHIFSLLNRLKKICNHPASAYADINGYEKYRCGKWELFVELLTECLESGHKVVVFSTSLDMLSIMQQFCAKEKIGHAVLTGATRHRTSAIRSFNTDPGCRLFLGSLKAGGVGVDLTSGSIVIHYDRWWNAAKEDQATDRVHRIGQTRGVQVFKLITQETIEASIDSIIERKRQLSVETLHADSAEALKIFTRQELLEILQHIVLPKTHEERYPAIAEAVVSAKNKRKVLTTQAHHSTLRKS
ncbi:MAG: DEAD/DEAH box helicase [Chitinivibrionales bacterium]|nr:DEAD/DEAH box helicase [Chitinivibrionales bacterium]